MKSANSLIWTAALFGVMGLWGCPRNAETPDESEAEYAEQDEQAEIESEGPAEVEPEAPATAIAELTPTQGNEVHGTVTFTATENGIHVYAEVEGLTPGLHGFHIHEKGDCSSPDGKSAGGHFNPAGVDHGGPTSATRHVGDLGNLDADEQGHAVYDRVDPVLSLTGDNSILGRAVIVHAVEDDLTSQPTGAAGARVACGEIRVQEGRPATAGEAPGESDG